MRVLIIFLLSTLILACKDEPEVLNEQILANYLELNASLEMEELVACAGGKAEGLLGDSTMPTDIFFYPVEGATDFRYFETSRVEDYNDFSKYVEKTLESEPVFNGYLWKFNRAPFVGELFGIVTYKTPGNIHVCNPIRLKTNVKPTEVNSELVSIQANGVNPTFNWSDGIIDENNIYFQVISDMENYLISGTYTTEKNFTFYDLSNVVFNITRTTPELEENKNYKFTMMAVSEDNWVNLIIEKEFSTE